ncbi:hypothetical protein CEXT_78341 [Caerostris extrusa]|uniref:Uncharacterized protein n=1 Tax=Caerostris extrusa TaxID=172846 RepID=A0AAV4RU23_CAEEX|nr:hypothetical protein CEXT_78341 [Caerostris extrusa]
MNNNHHFLVLTKAIISRELPDTKEFLSTIKTMTHRYALPFLFLSSVSRRCPHFEISLFGVRRLNFMIRPPPKRSVRGRINQR